MKEDLLQILREPDTGAALELAVSESRDGEFWGGKLRSVATGKEYPIRAGIPRFVPTDDYTTSFGLQWNRFSQVQLDSVNRGRYSHRRFAQEVGWTENQLNDQWVLDGGCGSGRFAEIAAELGGRIIAFDYSSAVDAAAFNLRAHRNVHYVQGDLLHPPIEARSLPFAYSIGVLHHTPDPGAALASLLDLLRPGAAFAVTIYGKRWYTPLFSKYLVRPVTRRMPPELLLRAVEISMPVLFPLTSMLFRAPVVGRVAQFAIPVANYVDKTDFTPAQRYQEAILDTFDMLAPAFDLPMTPAQVESALKKVGIHDFCFRTTTPINVTGTAPSA